LSVIAATGEVVYKTEYCLDGIPGPIPGDFITPACDEDFDIGLLACNISANPERRAFLADK